MADYGRPQPADPLWYRRGWFYRIQCDCGRKVILSMDDLSRFHRLPGKTLVYDVIRRMRCRECGQRPEYVDIAPRPKW
ncbi:hypothetical protein F1640_14835 [Novosphingobium sp. NBM11]|uniref:hypothetical protein n=1 Tax=Novosphingobium sp. NBM11 TaxID=2596914 RepID=UPI001892689D|nr:hypothetical protein [Novosphingobium sp. NBM11]MBF5091262.1 hypothetical protein [Novosphingobium sp. NBM11]